MPLKLYDHRLQLCKERLKAREGEADGLDVRIKVINTLLLDRPHLLEGLEEFNHRKDEQALRIGTAEQALNGFREHQQETQKEVAGLKLERQKHQQVVE